MFFTQCNYLPMAFEWLELEGEAPFVRKKKQNVVRKLMLDSWNQSIFSNLKNRLQESVTKLVHSERNGDVFESQLVIGVRDSYINLCSNSEDKLQIYKDNFEKAYIDATEAFYRAKVPQYLEASGVQNYMKYADQKLKEEEQRATKYLESYSGSIQLLIECCVNVLVTLFKEVILAECMSLLKYNETEKLQLMVKLMDRVPDGISPMLKDLEHHIINQGLADMIASADIITQALYQVVNDTSVFQLELPFGIGNKTQPESRCPELLANYCDMLLRKTPLNRKFTSDEIEAKLKEVVFVLKYVQNKDVFMMHHKAHLMRRLILDSSADSEKEENMVQWLRDVGMPADYVNKLVRMFQDVKVSEDLNKHFKDNQQNKGSIADSINIKILSRAAWVRCTEHIPVSLPLELESFIPEVEEFYRQKHNGRKLQWYHHMSNGTITFSNLTGKFDLEVTIFQMAALFAWNQRPFDKISFENLKLATEIPDAKLRQTLWSLVAFPKLKHQILVCSPEAKSPNDFDDSTSFWVNQEFSPVKNNNIQITSKVNLIGRLQLSIGKIKDDDNKSIVQLRILRTQEAIVKIMKMRKKVTNAQLQTELVEILKNMFLPTKKMIKVQIEWLIEHEYMERDQEDISVFIYMAWPIQPN